LLPLFIELRRIGSSESIREFLIDEIGSFGLDCDDEIFDFLASKGKLCLLLDGFDEVRENDR
jgi:predicted NACHT family NTPase